MTYLGGIEQRNQPRYVLVLRKSAEGQAQNTKFAHICKRLGSIAVGKKAGCLFYL